MLLNKDVAISTSRVLLVPYESRHVPTYHEWMKNEDIQEATASEPLSISEEYSMQKSWRNDADKLTFIACQPSSSTTLSSVDDSPSRMLGDVNLFLTPADEDDEGCIGEIELMIAPTALRRQGYGRATLLAFLNYIQVNLEKILDEYKVSQGQEKMQLLQLRVKIGSKNVSSINLFESVGFVKVSESANYFGELELQFEGFLGDVRIEKLMERFDVEGYREVGYVDV